MQRAISAQFVSWVDLNNAYGSVSHMQLQFALAHYHVPPPICELMFKYYECLIGRVITDKWTSNWFGFEVGLFQGSPHQQLTLMWHFNQF
jgi:hypothetical protein